MNEITLKLWGARSRLDRQLREQPNTHSFRFFEIYKIFIPLHRSDLKISAKSHLIFWSFIFHSRFSIDFAIFLRNFDEIMPEFHRNVQEMTKNVDNPYSLRKTESLNYLKIWKTKKFGQSFKFESAWPPCQQLRTPFSRDRRAKAVVQPALLAAAGLSATTSLVRRERASESTKLRALPVTSRVEIRFSHM